MAIYTQRLSQPDGLTSDITLSAGGLTLECSFRWDEQVYRWQGLLDEEIESRRKNTKRVTPNGYEDITDYRIYALGISAWYTYLSETFLQLYYWFYTINNLLANKDEVLNKLDELIDSKDRMVYPLQHKRDGDYMKDSYALMKAAVENDDVVEARRLNNINRSSQLMAYMLELNDYYRDWIAYQDWLDTMSMWHIRISDGANIRQTVLIPTCYHWSTYGYYRIYFIHDDNKQVIKYADLGDTSIFVEVL